MKSSTRSLAKKILDTVREKFNIRHEYNTVNPNNFPHLDQNFYRQSMQELLRAGYSYLADIEDLTLKRQKPDPRTYLKVLAGPGKTTVVALYHVKPRFPWPILMWLSGLTPARVVEFESEFSDGSFVITTKMSPKGAFIECPGIEKRFISKNVPLTRMAETHRENCDRHLVMNPGIKPIIIDSVGGLLEMQNRQLALLRSYLEENGWVTKEHLLGHTGGNKSLSEKLYRDIQAILREEKEQAQDLSERPY